MTKLRLGFINGTTMQMLKQQARLEILDNLCMKCTKPKLIQDSYYKVSRIRRRDLNWTPKGIFHSWIRLIPFF